MESALENKQTRMRLHDRYPEVGREPLPLEPYISRDFFELEKKHIFKKMWLHVGRIEEIANPGDYFVRDLPACDASILVTRNRQGVVRAMHNVCAHRSNKLVYDHSGCTKLFVCKFHAWGYDLDGNLRGLPDQGAFEEFDRKNYGLTPVHVDVWEGFIFINLAPVPAMSLAEFVRPMYSGLEGYPFHEMRNCYSWRAVVNCNWKLALDAFQETYHVPFVHRNSIASSLEKSAASGIRPLDGLCGEFHRRLSIAGNPKTVYGNPNAATGTPLKLDADGGGDVNSKIAMLALKHAQGGARFEFAGRALPEGLNWTRSPNWAFDINVFFPDFYLSTRPNYFQAYNFTPLAHNKFLFDARVYYPEMTTAGGRFYQEYMKVLLRDVLLEDLFTLENVQAGCETRAKSHMLLNDFEIMPRHSLWVVQRLIREGEAQNP